MPDCDRVCQGVPGSVSGIPQIQIVLSQQVNVLCQAMTGNFITTRVRERRNIFVELTMACVMTLPDTPIVSKAVGVYGSGRCGLFGPSAANGEREVPLLSTPPIAKTKVGTQYGHSNI